MSIEEFYLFAIFGNNIDPFGGSVAFIREYQRIDNPAVILHGLDVVDGVAKRIAEVEGIPLAVSRVASPEDIVERMKGFE